jgi:Secretion system C-terminal sorting domain
MKKTIFTLTCILFAIAVSAKTWIVRPEAGTGVDFTSIIEAMASPNVVDGDVLDVKGEFATEQISLSKEITIKGNGTDNTIIKASGTNRIFVSYNNQKKFTVSDLTIQGGAQTGEPGAGFFVYMAPDCIFENVHFKDMNTTSNGGAILINTTQKFTIRNCEFINNKAGAVGGCIYLTTIGGVGLIENCTFEGNGAVNNGWGDAIILDNGSAEGDSLLIQNCTFFNNGQQNVGLGGTIAINYGNIRLGIVNNTFANNRGNDNVGDLFLIPNSGFPKNLYYIGNLFYNSRGIIIPNDYPKDAFVAYNLSTNSINVQEGIANINYDPTINIGGCVAGTDLKLELNNDIPYLNNNGGKVRTIKLIGQTFEDNLAIEFIAEPVGAKLDARGMVRKATYQDCGAYEVGGLNTGIRNPKMGKLNLAYNAATKVVTFSETVSGKVQVFNSIGQLQRIPVNINANTLDLSSLSKGIFVIRLTNTNKSVKTAKVIVY